MDTPGMDWLADRRKGRQMETGLVLGSWWLDKEGREIAGAEGPGLRMVGHVVSVLLSVPERGKTRSSRGKWLARVGLSKLNKDKATRK